MFILYGRLPFLQENDILKEPPKISYKSDSYGNESSQRINSVLSKARTLEKAQEFKAEPVEEKKIIAEEIIEDKDVLLDVPFASQAPLGNWADPMQQNGCEEAAAIMAMAWINGEEKLPPEDIINEIKKISNYETEKYGGYIDTNAEDTALRIFKDYFKYDNIEAKHGISIENIKQELFKGNLIIVPANGRKLGNPYYTPPGPLTHMLVVKGYDAAKKEFITNDGGTRHGENFRYKEKIFETALLDYPTGDHSPISEIKTAMIIVRKFQ